MGSASKSWLTTLCWIRRSLEDELGWDACESFFEELCSQSRRASDVADIEEGTPQPTHVLGC